MQEETQCDISRANQKCFFENAQYCTDSDSSRACAKSHPAFCSPLIHSVVSIDSVCGQRRPWSDCAAAWIHVFARRDPYNVSFIAFSRYDQCLCCPLERKSWIPGYPKSTYWRLITLHRCLKRQESHWLNYKFDTFYICAFTQWKAFLKFISFFSLVGSQTFD